MKALLICPEHRAAGGFFQRMKPLALMPVAGRSLLDLTLAELKRDGFNEVVVLASDRPEMIRKEVGQGRAWGLKVEVRGVRAELARDVAETEHAMRKPGERRPLVKVVDRVPGMFHPPLWEQSKTTIETLIKAAEDPVQAAQVTMHEQSPGVWISTKANVSRKAKITGPVWIGPHATVRLGAQVGPGAVIERGAFIDANARVENSWVGPDTYVGRDLTIQDSGAWGQGLLSLKWNSFLDVRDPFFVTDLTSRVGLQSRASLGDRLLGLMLMAMTLPIALALMLKNAVRFGACFDERRVVLGPATRVDAFSQTWKTLNLRGSEGLIKRWPELWEVIRGRLALVGNRPLTLEDCSALRGTMGEMWMRQASGVFSLADARGEERPENPIAARAHAAYFSAHNGFGLRLRILACCLPRFVLALPLTGNKQAAGVDNDASKPSNKRLPAHS